MIAGRCSSSAAGAIRRRPPSGSAGAGRRTARSRAASASGRRPSVSTSSGSSCSPVDDELPGLDERPRLGPQPREVVGRVVRLGELEDEPPRHGRPRDALLDLGDDVLRRQVDVVRRVHAGDARHRHPAEPKRLPAAVGVDEPVRVEAVEPRRREARRRRERRSGLDPRDGARTRREEREQPQRVRQSTRQLGRWADTIAWKSSGVAAGTPARFSAVQSV